MREPRSEVLPVRVLCILHRLQPVARIAGPASLEIETLRRRKIPTLSPAAISEVFGTPKPTLSHSYRPGLLYLRTFPTLMGYSSRLLAESWESNGFYYASLADELGVPANQLEVYVPAMDAGHHRKHFRHSPGRLAGAASFFEFGGR